MLSRTAANLYWIGRYMERAEFTTRLMEATLRLSSLSYGADAASAAWVSALAVVGRGPPPGEATTQAATAFNVCRTLALDGCTVVAAFDREFVFVGVTAKVARESHLLTGSCEIKDSAETASALAVLDATNRWIAYTK